VFGGLVFSQLYEQSERLQIDGSALLAGQAVLLLDLLFPLIKKRNDRCRCHRDAGNSADCRPWPLSPRYRNHAASDNTKEQQYESNRERNITLPADLVQQGHRYAQMLGADKRGYQCGEQQ